MPKSATTQSEAAPRLCRVAGRDTWHVYDNRRRISTGCADRAEAELVLSRYLVERGRPQLAIRSVASILESYLSNRRERNIPGAERLAWAHKPLARLIGAKPPDAINEAECRRYAAARRKEGVADATVRTELQALRAAMRWCAEPEIGAYRQAASYHYATASGGAGEMAHAR
jgi:hypothetical protein